MIDIIRSEEPTLLLEEFDDALDRYGAHLALWPEAQREAAERLMASSTLAGQHWQAAARVESALGALTAVPGRAGPRLVADNDRPRQMPQPQMNPRRLAAWGSALLAASLVIGFVAGTTFGGPSDDGPTMAMADLDVGGQL